MFVDVVLVAAQVAMSHLATGKKIKTLKHCLLQYHVFENSNLLIAITLYQNPKQQRGLKL